MPNDIKNDDLVWITCLNCNRHTEHSVKGVFHRGENEPVAWSSAYQILSCNGCKTVTFKVSSSDEDSWNGEEYAITEEFYPSRKTGRDSAFGHLRFRNPSIPREVHIIYIEVITAINNSLPLLAAVGIRLIIEAICRKEKCAAHCKKNKLQVNLKNQINALVAKQVITGRQAKVLHKPRFLGNNAAHEILAPTETEIFAALDITELMLRTIYMLDSLGRRITSVVQTEKREARRDKKRAAKKAAKFPPLTIAPMS